MGGYIGRITQGALTLLALLGVLSASDAHAQSDPDMREIYPYLMLVIDTSGSMERLPACTCTSPGCEECLPKCNLANDAAGEAPKDPVTFRELKKNRWAVTLEALTGKFQNFECTQLDRTNTSQFTFDYRYYMPYHQPWKCAVAGEKCAFNATGNTRNQLENGILDEYKGRVNFGLMTFDGWDTWVGAPPLVAAPPSTDFIPNGLAMSEGESGLWSYGGPKTFHYPNCTTNYMMDTGARSPDADQGYLVSIDSCRAPTPPSDAGTCKSWCHGTCWRNDPSEIIKPLNENIQEALLATRPYGGTPIAASLDDLYHHLNTDIDDTFKGCRRRFALLMTDGYPDDDYRTFGCDCKTIGDCPVGQDPNLMHCPYPLPEDAADKLVRGGGKASEPPVLEQLFVVGLAVEDTAVLNRLDAIADKGCTKAGGCKVNGHSALFASNLPQLVSSMSNIIQSVLHPISRSVPVFAGANATGVEQYQISTGFDVPIERDRPWTGVIERRRFTCDSGDQLVPVPIEAQDELHNVVSTQDNLTLWTTLPQPGPTFTQDGWVYGREGGTPCGTPSGTDPSGCKMISLKDSTISNPVLGLGTADNLKHTEILNWMYGENNSPRDGHQMGDIYHSSPVILRVPTYDTADEAFNVFRTKPIVKDRPLTMFVGTNDGMIRAISVEDFRPTTGHYAMDRFGAGEQMWGFVPPMMLRRLQDNLTDHRITMDGTPVVKDVYFDRNLSAKSDANANNYHTVLITGMRGGGRGYIALDVTDPTDPKFLWQFTDDLMGNTYAQPAIAQAVWTDSAGRPRNGAIAILPGGLGTIGPSGVSGDCTNGATNPQMRLGSTPFFSIAEPSATTPVRDMQHRADIRCWKPEGRSIYIVDVASGELIKRIALDTGGRKYLFTSPMVSTPVIFQSEAGSLASRAFLTDADGVIWRVDLTSADPVPNDGMKGWTARPFHDIFWDGTPTSGERSFEAPVMSIDELGRVVLIVGTGDTDNFVKATVRNKVVSVTELLTNLINVEPAELWAAGLNWEKVVKPTNGLVESELVTGSMGLVAGQLYFGSFIAVSGGNACNYGRGRIHAVDFVKRDITDENPALRSGVPKTFGPKPLTNVAVGTDASSIINVSEADAASNLMIMGLGITQRPSCELDNPNLQDPWGLNTVADVSSHSEPALFVVAQGTGDTGPNSVLKTNKGLGRLLNVQLEVKRPKTQSRVLSWATSVD